MTPSFTTGATVALHSMEPDSAEITIAKEGQSQFVGFCG